METKERIAGARNPSIEDSRATIEELKTTIAELRARIERLEELVGGRNKSAPTKRNMTDADAREALTGSLKDLDHKEAAERGGLTYAQVYSCRKEFTFKHVHKELRRAGWANPWAK